MQRPLLDIRPVAARGAEILVRLHTESWRSAYWDLLSDDVSGVRAEYMQECLLRASGGQKIEPAEITVPDGRTAAE